MTHFFKLRLINENKEINKWDDDYVKIYANL